MERWLGELEQCSALLLTILTDIMQRNKHDPDVQGGLRILHDISTRMYERIKPMAEKYQDDKDWGKRRAHLLAETLFFNHSNNDNENGNDDDDDDNNKDDNNNDDNNKVDDTPPLTHLNSSYLVLETLQSLHVYLAYITGNLRALDPAAQAIWDPQFTACVRESEGQVARMQKWVLQQVQRKAPQTLIVPLSTGG